MITIACDQGHITAHKTVLCDYSQYLNDILSKYPQADHPIVILTDLNISAVKVLVNYMYTGELVITNSSPTSLLNAAQILKIDRLTADTSSQDQTPSTSSPTSPELVLNNYDINHDHLHTPQNSNNNNNNNSSQLNNNSNSINNINNSHHHLNLHQQAMQSSVAHLASVMPIDDDVFGIDPFEADMDDDDQIGLKNNQNSNNKIRCHLCNIGLSDVKCLYRHVLTRHLPEKWGYKCEFCDREFSRDDHLMRHYTTKHKNMEFDRERIRETRRLNREMAKNFHDEISTKHPQLQQLQHS